MRQPQSSVLPISPPGEPHDPPGHRRDRPSLTERVAGWSAAHRKTAVFGWLLLVAAIFMTGQAAGSKNLRGHPRKGRPHGALAHSMLAPTRCAEPPLQASAGVG